MANKKQEAVAVPTQVQDDVVEPDFTVPTQTPEEAVASEFAPDAESVDVSSTEENVVNRPAPVVVRVLSRYCVKKRGQDSYVYENVKLNKNYAGQKNVKEFVASNGKVTYYVEKLVKKYSDNVVKA